MEFNPVTVLQSGATSLREIVPLELLPSVLGAYNDALDNTYTLSIVMGFIACVASCGMEWVSVREKLTGWWQCVSNVDKRCEFRMGVNMDQF